jgi:hypothetical protein
LLVSDFVPYAQIGSGLAAAVGLILTAWQLWRARTTATLQSLQEFFKTSNEREAALAKAKGDKRHAFIEFMNFLEVYSAAANSGLLAGVTLELVNDKLIDSIVVLMQLGHWHEVIGGSITSPITYKHIRKFIERHKKTIDGRYTAAEQEELRLIVQAEGSERSP